SPACGGGLGRGRRQAFSRRRPDELPRTLEIPENLLIRNPQHQIAASLEPRVALQVVSLPLLEVVSFAVNLDDETRRVADEIRNVVTHRHLATKAETVEMMSLEVSPEESLRPGHSLAEILCSLPLLVGYEIAWQWPPP